MVVPRSPAVHLPVGDRAGRIRPQRVPVAIRWERVSGERARSDSTQAVESVSVHAETLIGRRLVADPRPKWAARSRDGTRTGRLSRVIDRLPGPGFLVGRAADTVPWSIERRR